MHNILPVLMYNKIYTKGVIVKWKGVLWDLSHVGDYKPSETDDYKAKEDSAADH